MKNAIATFITEHPFLSFLFADALIVNGCKTIIVLLRGYPTEETRTITDSGSDLDEVVDDIMASN